MKACNIKLDVKKMMENAFAIDGPTKTMVYKDGKPTDEVDSYKYQIIAPGCGYEKMVVRTKKPSIEVSEENPVKVTFQNLEYKLWVDYSTREIRFSLTADSVVPVTANRLKLRENAE